MSSPVDALDDPDVRAILGHAVRLRIDGSDVGAISDSIEDLFRHLGSEDVGELMASAVEREMISPERAAAFLATSVWSGSTNGAQLHRTLERWLEEGADAVRLALALRHHVFLFERFEEMRDALARVAIAHPEHAERCNELIGKRRRQGV